MKKSQQPQLESVEAFDKKTEDSKQQFAAFDFYKYNKATKNKDDKTKIDKYKNALETDLRNTIDHWTKTIFPKWVQSQKNYQLCGFDRAIELDKADESWKTNLKQPVTRGYVDLCHRTIYTSKISTKVVPLMDGDGDTVQKILEWCWADSKTRKALNDIAFDVSCHGVGYARSGFRSPTHIGNTNGVSLGQFEYVSSYNIFAEPTVDFYNQRVIYYRKIISLSDGLKKAELLLGKNNLFLTPEAKDIIEKTPQAISTKNFDNVKMIKYYEDLALAAGATWKENQIYDVNYKGGLCEYIEVWKEETLDILINGFIVASVKNPRSNFNKKYNSNRCFHPFKVFNFSRISGVWISDGAGTMLEQIQDQYDTLMNMIFDLARFNSGPMLIPAPGQTFPNGAGKLEYKPLGFLDINGINTGDIKKFTLGDLDASNFKVIQDMMDMVNFNLMPTSYNQVQGVSRSATDSQYRYEGLLDSVKNMIALMTETLDLVYHEWADGAANLLPDDYGIPNIKRVKTGKGKKKITIKKDAIKGDYIFEMEFDSVREMNKIIERQQAAELLGILERYKQDPETGQILVSYKEILQWIFEKYSIDVEKFVLDPEESKERIINAQKMQIDVQLEVNKYQQEKQKESGFVDGQPSFGQQQPGQDQEQPVVDTTIDPRSAVGTADQGPVETPEPEMDLAAILKKSAE